MNQNLVDWLCPENVNPEISTNGASDFFLFVELGGFLGREEYQQIRSLFPSYKM